MSRLTIPLLALMTMAVFASPIAAQDEFAESALDDPGQLDGIEVAVNRVWSIDYQALFTMSEADAAAMTGIAFLSATAMSFDSADNASAAFTLYRDEGVASLQAELDTAGDGSEVISGDVTGLGDEAYSIDVAYDDEETAGIYRIVLARHGSYLYVAFGFTMDSHPESAAGIDQVVAYMVNEGQPGEGVGTFNFEGTSEGGLWGVFPATDFEPLVSLMVHGDELIFPEPET